ncbi:MAG: hypothetical protein ABMB14_33115 [Myxococcota bacterium]
MSVPNIHARFVAVSREALIVEAEILDSANQVLELRATPIATDGCRHDPADGALTVTHRRATVRYRVDEPGRYVDRGVLRAAHSDLQPSWKLSALIPTPRALADTFRLAITLPPVWEVVESNGADLVWPAIRRLDPYFVAREAAEVPRFVLPALKVGGENVDVVTLGADLRLDAAAILVALGDALGPLGTDRVVVDVTDRLPPTEYRYFVRTGAADLRHELAHLWFGGRARAADEDSLWIDEAAVMLLTEPTRPEIDGVVPGLTAGPSGCTPRIAYDYGADTLRRSVGSADDALALLRRLLDRDLSTVALGDFVAEDRHGWLADRLTGPARGSPKGLPVPNDVFGRVFGSPTSAMAMAMAAAQIMEGPLHVFDAGGVKKAVAHRFTTSADHYKEYWALLTGFRLGPATAAGATLTRSFDMPSSGPTDDTWAAFETWANSELSGTKDWFLHVVEKK